MKSVLFVHARRLECNQQVSAAYCKVGNDEYIESYGKTYDGYLYIYRERDRYRYRYRYIQTCSLYYSYMWGSLRLADGCWQT